MPKQIITEKRETTQTYPYQNTEITDLQNEQWEDIPGLDGYYCVSNFGRIKRMEYELVYGNGLTRYMCTKICKPSINRVKNNSVNDYVYFLSAHIGLSGKRYTFSIPRLVYYCFVKEFNWSNYHLVVILKDGDGKNIIPANLALVDLSRKAKRIFERNRLIREFTYSYDEYINQGLIKSANSYCRQISQYSKEGKRIQTFPSIKAASKALDLSENGIKNVLKDRQVSHGGYLWRYGKAEWIDVKSFLEKKKLHRKKIIGQKVSQYNTAGERVATYYTIDDAAKISKINRSDLWAVLNGKQRSAGGFIWKKGWGKEKIDLSNYLYGVAFRAQKRQKKVKQYTLEGKYIQTFVSLKAAAQHLNTTTTNIIHAIKKQKTAAGYKWNYG